jgi:hypothetical protein
MNRRIVVSVLALFLALFLAVPAASAHPSPAVKRTHAQCETLKKKKKVAACKACMTRYKGKRHYHPHAKKGNRCHKNGTK